MQYIPPDYKVERILGTGSFATVYKATNKAGAVVALKVMKKTGSVARFLARTAQRTHYSEMR